MRNLAEDAFDDPAKLADMMAEQREAAVQGYEKIMESTVVSQFKQRLAETIAWCAGRASINAPSECLRTPALRPYMEEDTYRYGLVTQGEEVLSQLVNERAELLHSEGQLPMHPSNTLAGGRLLLYQPDASFAEALAEDETSGFFDKWDAPPWDTWLWYLPEGHITYFPAHSVEEGLLVSWVPPAFVELAQQGIEVQPYGGIHWADEIDIPLIRALRAERLVDG